MASNQHRRTGTAITSSVDPKKTGLKVDPGPYVGIVRDFVKGTRMGQLLVEIPEWSTTSTSTFVKVSYCSPFYGKTFGTDTDDLPDSPTTSGQSYGMFMVPPDLGNKVLCIFANGDRDRGYWIGCVYDSPSHHMVPALGRNIAGPNKTILPPTPLSTSVGATSVLPVMEYNTGDPTAYTADGLTATPRQTHQYQAAVLIKQGLDRDPIRGAISSSSLREMPSNVYGISTPGRSATQTAQVPSNPNATIFRTGGHSFVMDDGAAGDSVNPVGTDQLIRLRTTSGHQILMNDTENVLYVASASGDQWLEFSNDGQIHVYSTNAINMRTKGVMNFHADGAIIMNSPIIEMNAVDTSGGTGQSAIVMNTPGSIAMSAQTGISAQTNGSLGLSATMGSFNCLATLGLSSAGMTSVYGTLLKLNTGFPGIPNINLNSTPLNKLDDTVYSDGTNAWVKSPHTITSACTTVPAHEPWVGPDGKSRPLPQIPGQPAGSALGTLAVGAALAGLASTIGGALF